MQFHTMRPPPELLQPTPRQAVPKGAYYAQLLLVLAITVLPFCGITAASAWTAHRMEQLLAEGQFTPGEVAGLYTTTYRGATTDHVAYAYRALDGRAFEGNVPAPPALFRLLYPGERLRVFYLPADEAYSTLGFVLRTTWRRPWRHFRAQMLASATTFGGLLVVMLAFLHWRYRRERKLVSLGIAASATLVAQRRATGVFGGRWRINCTFRTEDGARLSATGFRFAPLEAGQPLWVLYDPQNPRRNLLYPATLAKCRDAG